MTRNQKMLALAAVGFLAVAGTAVGASYLTRESMAPAPQVATAAPMQHHYHQAPQQMAAAQPRCNDHNIVGTVGGGLAGALVGNQFGKGSGKTIATVGGAAGGAYLGNEYIPTRGATCN